MSVPNPTNIRPSPRKLTWRRRLLFNFGLLTAVYAVLELVSLAVIFWQFGGLSGITQMLAAASRADPLGAVELAGDEIVHPYQGYVLRPSGEKGAKPGERVSDFGFIDDRPPLHRRAPDQVLIGILGGSVAEQFGQGGADTLRAELQADPKFAGRRIIFVPLALRGYKQPQQLLTLAYLLSLGAEFDYIINLDGFNEVALPVAENAPAHVFAAFPRNWHLRVSEAHNPAVLRLIGRITHYRGLMQRGALTALRSPWHYSATALVLWKAYDDVLQRAVFRDRAALNQQSPAAVDLAATGPRQEFGSSAELLEHCVAVWKRSSLELDALCRFHGIAYYHFLQPNQYLPGSKPMGNAERNAAYQADHPYRPGAEQGYPLLRREGADLQHEGVRFHDLTQLFADHAAPVYSDSCCHFNESGNILLAKEIARILRENAEP